jgi:L-ascorbate metabolism protein UlaG (beta-lactamase superfamily)
VFELPVKLHIQSLGAPALKITQIRNATVLLEFESDGKSIGLLVDPMLSKLGAMPAFKYFGASVRRNPTVDLPSNTPELLQRVTHGLITHCQRGHVDHLDRAGTKFLRDGKIPVFCMPRDSSFLTARKLSVRALSGEQTQPFFHGQITPIPCVHGRGWVSHLMEHGYGYFIDLPGEPSVYIAGDTILTGAVRFCLTQRQPRVAILPAGGAQFDLGAEIIMNAKDVIDACGLTTGIVFANHLEALDHCPTTRAELTGAAVQAGLPERLLIPDDGAAFEFHL